MHKLRNANIQLMTFYNDKESFLPFPYNPLNGKEFKGVDVKIDKANRKYSGIEVLCDTISISGEEIIDCEFIGISQASNGTYIIKICQDWG